MERAETPANLPKNVEEAAGIFRVGEDAELAYRLQEQGLYGKKHNICAFFILLFYFFRFRICRCPAIQRKRAKNRCSRY